MSKILYVNETPAHLLRLRTERAQRVQIMRIRKHDEANTDIITLSKKEAIAISVNILLSYPNELLQIIEEIKEKYKNEIEEIKQQH